MNRNITESRKFWLEQKKKDSIGMKVRFICDTVFRKFRHFANMRLNECGWQFAENSDDHRLWKLYHCDLEELERLCGFRCRNCYMAARPADPPVNEMREIFDWYLPKAYELYKRSLHWYTGLKPAERHFYDKWFENTLKKTGNKSWLLRKYNKQQNKLKRQQTDEDN